MDDRLAFIYRIKRKRLRLYYNWSNVVRTLSFQFIIIFSLISGSALAKTVSMVCSDVHYRYTKKLFFDAKVEMRSKGTWVPFCENGDVTELGASCPSTRVSEKSYNVSITQKQLDRYKKNLSQRLINCRKWQARINAASAIKKAPLIARRHMDCKRYKSGDFQFWDPVNGRPVNEIEKFWELSDRDYLEKHLPKVGKYAGKMAKYEEFVVYLDFITYERAVYEIRADGQEYSRSEKQCEAK